MTTFLMHPRASCNWSTGIFINTMKHAFQKRGITCWDQFFHYTGITLRRPDYVFLMGTPRQYHRVRQLGIPYILTIGEPEDLRWCQKTGFPYTPEHRLQEMLMFQAILDAPRVVFNSQRTLATWQSIFQQRQYEFLPPEKYRSILHGIDCSLFCPGQAEPTEFVLGCAGAMRFDFRLRTFFAVSRRLPFPHRLLIVGSLDEINRQTLAEARKDSELNARITYIPWVKYYHLPLYYRQMSCLLHPVDFESCGIVVQEALSCGTPVVVPAYGACREYVGNGGYVAATREFEYGSEFCEAMTAGVMDIYKHREEYGRQARVQALKFFSSSMIAEQYLDFMKIVPDSEKMQ